MPAWVPAPDCSRRRIIPGIAAAVAKPPRIARGHRQKAPATMWRSGMLSRTATILPPLPLAGRGRGWGEQQRRHPWSTPHPDPPPQGGREQKSKRERGTVGALPTSEASTNHRSANSRRRITARLPPFPRSIRSLQNNSASPPRRKTPRRWRGRRATRWKRSALPPPRTRWRI
jgi:hypothetical protein